MTNSGATEHPVKKKILVVEDHEAVRQGMVEFINRENDLVVCGEADDVLPALELLRTTSADLVLIDIQLKSSNGIDLIKELREQYPDLPVIGMTMFDPIHFEKQALAAGARAFVVKQQGPEKLLETVRHALA
jgi:DNA-binding NarL/FixJ family response regulator